MKSSYSTVTPIKTNDKNVKLQNLSFSTSTQIFSFVFFLPILFIFLTTQQAVHYLPTQLNQHRGQHHKSLHLNPVCAKCQMWQGAHCPNISCQSAQTGSQTCFYKSVSAKDRERGKETKPETPHNNILLHACIWYRNEIWPRAQPAPNKREKAAHWRLSVHTCPYAMCGVLSDSTVLTQSQWG